MKIRETDEEFTAGNKELRRDHVELGPRVWNLTKAGGRFVAFAGSSLTKSFSVDTKRHSAVAPLVNPPK